MPTSPKSLTSPIPEQSRFTSSTDCGNDSQPRRKGHIPSQVIASHAGGSNVVFRVPLCVINPVKSNTNFGFTAIGTACCNCDFDELAIQIVLESVLFIPPASIRKYPTFPFGSTFTFSRTFLIVLFSILFTSRPRRERVSFRSSLSVTLFTRRTI